MDHSSPRHQFTVIILLHVLLSLHFIRSRVKTSVSVICHRTQAKQSSRGRRQLSFTLKVFRWLGETGRFVDALVTSFIYTSVCLVGLSATFLSRASVVLCSSVFVLRTRMENNESLHQHGGKGSPELLIKLPCRTVGQRLRRPVLSICFFWAPTKPTVV